MLGLVGWWGLSGRFCTICRHLRIYPDPWQLNMWMPLILPPVYIIVCARNSFGASQKVVWLKQNQPFWWLRPCF